MKVKKDKLKSTRPDQLKPGLANLRTHPINKKQKKETLTKKKKAFLNKYKSEGEVDQHDNNQLVGDDGIQVQQQQSTIKFLPEKIPKIRRSATNENVDDNFMIVPWASREEWDSVCVHFHDGRYKEVMTRIAVWQKRVPVLPVGVEASLFLLEALIYDEKFVSSQLQVNRMPVLCTEDQARSLYSLAIIRYLNHVSHLAAHSLGEGGGLKRIAKELVATVDTPDWLVTLRNDVSHGASAPSIEVLRMGGAFVLQWLKQKYWKLPEETGDTTNYSTNNDPFTILPAEINTENVPEKITDLLAAYIATKIYKLRKQFSIRDPEVLRHIPHHFPSSSSMKTKDAIKNIRNILRPYLSKHPSVFCTLFCQEIIPSFEFYEDFKAFLKFKQSQSEEEREQMAFDKFYGLWIPLVKMMESKGKLITVLGSLVELVVNPEFEKMWMMIARWIDKLLEIIESSGRRYSKHLVTILGVVVKRPNYAMHHFLERLFRLTEPRIGSEAVEKLDYLASIWMEERSETKKRRRQAVVTLFTLDDVADYVATNVSGHKEDISIDSLMNGSNQTEMESSSILWMEDKRSEDFWLTIPIGALL